MAGPIELIRHWLGILGYQAIAFGVMVATTLIAGVAVPPDVWGRYWLLLSLVQITAGIGLSWVSQSVLLFARAELRQSGELRRTLWSALALQGCVLAVLAVLGWLARPYLAAFVDLYPIVFLLLVLAVASMSAFETLAYALQADNRFQGLGAGAALGKLGPLVAAIAIWAGAPATPELLLMGLVLGMFAGLLGTASAMPPRTGAPTQPTLAAAREIVGYGARLPLAAAAGVASAWMHVWFVRAYSAPTDVGVYAWAASLYTLLNASLIPLSAVIAPHLADLALAGKQEQTQSRSRMFLAIILLGAVAMPALLGALRLVTLALPDRYAASGPILIAFCATVPALMMTYLSTPMLKAYPSQIGKFVTANIMMAGANVLLNFLLTPQFGGIGAAFALALSTWIGAIVIDRQTQRAIGSNQATRTRTTAVLAGAAVSTMLCALACNALDPVAALISGVFASTVLFALARFTGHLRGLASLVDHMTFLPHRIRHVLTRLLV